MEDNNKSGKYISIKYEKNEEDLINPSLVVFPLNYPNINSLNDPDINKFIICQNRDKKRKEDKLLLGESSKIIYESKSKTAKNLSDYVVGVFSKKKRELKFVDIDAIFQVNHKIRRIEEHSQKMEELERQKLLSGNLEEEPKNKSYIDNKLQLIKDFGTSKAKKAASGIKAHMVNENNISSVNAVKKLLEDTAIKQNLDVQMNEEQKQQNKVFLWQEILPQFDLKATDRKNIFFLESIIDFESMNELNIDLIIKMYNDDTVFDENKHRFSDFTHSLFRKFKKSKQGMGNIPYKIKSALFLDYLIKFYHLPKIIKSSPEILSKQNDIELYFINQFLEKFAEVSYHSGERDKNMKTNILILKNTYYILVLALMLSDYKLDYSILAKTMKIDDKQIYEYYKEIGCKLTDYKKIKNSKGAFVELEAPLKLNLENKIKYGNK